jgi:hypothetical protein
MRDVSAIRLSYDHRVAVLGAVTLLVVILAAVNKLDSLPEGLVATYFSDVNWSSAPVRSTIESQRSTDSLVDAWGGNPPPAFSPCLLMRSIHWIHPSIGRASCRDRVSDGV